MYVISKMILAGIISWLIPYLQFSVILALVVVYLGYKYSTYHFGQWKDLGIPYVEPTPLFGNIGGTLRGHTPLVELVHLFYHRFHNCRYFGIYEARKPMLVIRDPGLIHQVMVKDFSYFHDRISNKVSFEHDKLFDHLVNLRGERWKSVRTKLSPTFSAAKLKYMMSDINECTRRLVQNLDDNITKNDGLIDVSEISAQFTTDTIGRCAFGLDFNSLSNPNSEFRRTGRDVFAPSRRSTILNFIRLVGLGRLLDLLRIRGMRDHIFNFFDDLLETAIENHKTEGNTRNDFVSLLVKLKEDEKLDQNGEKIFDNDIIAANAFVFFIAGFETTASTMSYFLYEIALNSKIQNRLREEIKRTLDVNEGKLSYETLKDIKYLDMVINETLRLHPVVPTLIRVCTKKYTLPDSETILNVGQKLLIPTYSLHNDPKYYLNPKVFDPERFTEENIASRIPGTYLPFGDGPRICIGMRFAMMEAKLGLAEIISTFEITPCYETQIPIKVNPRSLLLTPNKPIRLNFKRIE